MTVGLYYNPEAFGYLPNARLTQTARDVFDILISRQKPCGKVVGLKQDDIAQRLDIPQPHVSRAIGLLRDKGIIDSRTRRGEYLIHPLLAGYESQAHMINHLRDSGTYVWPLNFPAGGRPPRDARAGTDFDPDPDGGEPAVQEEAKPYLYLATAS